MTLSPPLIILFVYLYFLVAWYVRFEYRGGHKYPISSLLVAFFWPIALTFLMVATMNPKDLTNDRN